MWCWAPESPEAKPDSKDSVVTLGIGGVILALLNDMRKREKGSRMILKGQCQKHTHEEARVLIQPMVLTKLDTPLRRMNFSDNSPQGETSTQSRSKFKMQDTKTARGKPGNTFQVTGTVKSGPDKAPAAQETGWHEIKMSLCSKEKILGTNPQPTGGEKKNFASCTSDRRLISAIYKEPKELKN